VPDHVEIELALDNLVEIDVGRHDAGPVISLALDHADH
jgi:hypothetical protein